MCRILDGMSASVAQWSLAGINISLFKIIDTYGFFTFNMQRYMRQFVTQRKPEIIQAIMPTHQGDKRRAIIPGSR
jgi:hypothetical protein